ncbi:alcohol dehydrogenase groES-like domain-containing protein [Sarocladium implicatum]|nr:alcohol dehydrogenase groES-like domain-containing protein [Sarocladium implicatum]
MSDIPKTMRALVATEGTGPKGYVITEISSPKITSPKQVIVRVRAGGLGGSEVKMTAGEMDILHKVKYPSKLGLEGSGIVAAVGSAVTHVKLGDEVYGLSVDKPMFQQEDPGWASEYAICEDRFLVLKPPHMSFEAAAIAMGNTVSTFQAIRKGLELRELENLDGMTVYIPAALGGLGSMAAQLAKKVFKATKVITSVSTVKVPLVQKHLPGIIDQVVDYQTQILTEEIKPGSVDFVVNTQMQTLTPSIPLLNPSHGTVVSLASIPQKETVREMLGPDKFPMWLGWILDLAQWYYWLKLLGTNIEHIFVSGSPNIREDIESVAKLLEQDGLLNPVFTTASLDDLEAVRAGCERARSGKGGLGHFVITIS